MRNAFAHCSWMFDGFLFHACLCTLEFSCIFRHSMHLFRLCDDNMVHILSGHFCGQQFSLQWSVYIIFFSAKEKFNDFFLHSMNFRGLQIVCKHYGIIAQSQLIVESVTISSLSKKRKMISKWIWISLEIWTNELLWSLIAPNYQPGESKLGNNHL